ncbi:hypothetical protein Scep_010978 [Stephania cephalantha]|uniref:Uncharacterized protein n=1 Tax=Stephania cephalantha TaxID=152367 RepID=A0AAP0JW76_9MAGN
MEKQIQNTQVFASKFNKTLNKKINSPNQVSSTLLNAVQGLHTAVFIASAMEKSTSLQTWYNFTCQPLHSLSAKNSN